MEKTLIYLTFLFWLLYYIRYVIKAIKETKNIKKENCLKWLKSNIFQIFRIDNIVLILIFLYFLKYNNELVDKLLFSAINLYLFVNSLYDKPNQKNKIKKSDFTLIIIILIFTSLPFIYFLKTHELQETYKMMFMYTFFAYVIVLIAKIISMLVAILVKKINKKH